MQYFFILGNNPTLSIAEISAVFNLKKGNESYLAAQNAFILKTNQDINPTELIKKLGGTIKIGKIHNQIQFNNQAIIDRVKILMDKQKKSGKFKFGISYYGGKIINLKPVGMAIKKYLKEKNISCRWVTSKEKTLSSVVVEQNKLTSRGIEIVLIQENEEILIGQTLAVQPFKELSFRDYGRPARDDYSGMLPPKLAQIMINLAIPVRTQDFVFPQKDITILDPFCGSGTILTEAMLMGYQNLIGSDISKKAVEDTKKNMSWTKDKFLSSVAPLSGAKEGHIPNSISHIHERNATKLSKFIKPNSIDAIITEPYLGPQRGKIDIKKTVQELEQLYSQSLAEFSKILKPNGRVVMVWPVFLKAKFANLAPRLNGFKIVNPLPKFLLNQKGVKLTNRQTIIYGRQGQKVWREIVILQNKST